MTTTEESWPIGPSAVTYDREVYEAYMSHPVCATTGCKWRVWYKNTLMDEAFPAAYRTYCSECAFWLYMHVQDSQNQHGRRGVVVLDEPGKRTHYVVDTEEPIKDRETAGFLGHSGRRFTVDFFGGPVIITNDLWCQNDVPERFWHLFPVNATLTTS